jgi:hypothetical protein
MTTIPISVTSSPSGFQPAFQRVQQSNDFDDIFACCAMLAGKTLEEVREIAIKKLNHPAHGPYFYVETQVVALLAQLGFVGTVYKEITRMADLQDVAFLMIDYRSDMEVGRHVLFHRAKASHDTKTVTEYLIDPAYWIKPEEQVRTDFRGLSGCWAIGIHAMNKAGVAK